MYCSKCGKQLDDDAVVCVGCGCPVKNEMKSNNKEPMSAGQVCSMVFFTISLILMLLLCVFTILAAVALINLTIAALLIISIFTMIFVSLTFAFVLRGLFTAKSEKIKNDYLFVLIFSVILFIIFPIFML